jgi:two-component system CheB/CheR fusion protein
VTARRRHVDAAKRNRLAILRERRFVRGGPTEDEIQNAVPVGRKLKCRQQALERLDASRRRTPNNVSRFWPLVITMIDYGARSAPGRSISRSMTDTSDHQPPEPRRRTQDEEVLVVAVAGTDVGAIERLVSELPPGRGMSFIITLAATPSPRRLNLGRLHDLTSLNVREAKNAMRLEPDTVYVAQQDEFVTVGSEELSVGPRQPESLPLDDLLRSLAQNHAERAAGILLSGIRSDGSIGAAEMKASGSLVILQAPANAVEANLPEQQLLGKGADLVLPVSRIANALTDYFKAPRDRPESAWSAPFCQQTLSPILTALNESTGHDFSRYKRSTVSRRIQRRMRVHGLIDPSHYAELLRARPAEAESLFNEMLIAVTSFFRDPETYSALQIALDEYLQRLPPQQDLRVWVPACSTGEEAYSMAILMHECVQRADKSQGVKMFATDVDAKAIDFARAGRYPLGISAYVSPERLERFFVQEDDTYRINKETRERIIFAPHNVTRDPPFTHIDLVSCRNLLIYLEPELQQQVLTLFEYALEPGGLLLLGGSESVGTLQNVFDLVDEKSKLFVHRATHVRRSLALPIDPLWGERSLRREARFSGRAGTRNHAASAAEQLLMGEFVPPSAIIAASGELAYIHGRTGRFLEPPVGEPSTNIFDMAREGLRLELPAAVRAAHHSQQPVVRRGLNVRTNGSIEPVTVTVKPLDQPETLRGLLLVTFDVEDHIAERMPASNSEQTSNLEAELHYVRTTLRAMIEDLASSNEELESMNEELQSTNEEVQSSNEELAASREELQSLNQELQTLNEELAQRNSMLSQSNDDMHNLLSSVHVATVFVDAQLNVKRFTAPAKKVFRLRDSDIGRPVSDLVVNLDYQTLVEDAQEVLRTLVFAEREVQTTEGEWRLMRILPYRIANDVIDGLIITVADIQRLKEAQRSVQQNRSLFEDVMASLPMPLVLLDEKLAVLTASVEFARRFGTTEANLIGKPLTALGSGWRHRAVTDRLQKLARGEPCPSFRLQGNLGAPVPTDVLVYVRRLQARHPKARYLLLIQDVATALPVPADVD